MSEEMPPPPKPNKETQVADSKLQKKVPTRRCCVFCSPLWKEMIPNIEVNNKVPPGEDRLNLVRLFSGQYERIVQVAKNSLKWGSHSDEPSIGLSNFLKGLIRNTMIGMKRAEWQRLKLQRWCRIESDERREAEKGERERERGESVCVFASEIDQLREMIACPLNSLRNHSRSSKRKGMTDCNGLIRHDLCDPIK
ncbi:hypothetical protein RUM43_005287 [Polyplax serrata]|uniref:Uncharacterized protein n=1 Tax=Polyplax serrata TaxID=468196 RepID=A0AAN8PWR1_POLSC